MFSLSFSTAVVSGNMERPRSSRLGAEILYALQKLKEILQQKNMQFALFELDVHSSKNNLSAAKNLKSNAGSSKLGADDAVEEKEEGMHKGSEIEQLSKRLKFLEEESKIMRQEFLEQVEEKEKLVKEIYKQFQTIYRCL
ncbi:uncharacterized protein LOC110614153 isoform X2 [Manihot esculenta]|uniref:uncharacterized protein LOC110614153 isoform X2 n=1 Tax=Manihot esculenta TaxID=3983 RepID=UPI000B5D3BF2|nr:uncharacterized protein LOC110614153 isoform X2 [Manihot esculenta]